MMEELDYYSVVVDKSMIEALKDDINPEWDVDIEAELKIIANVEGDHVGEFNGDTTHTMNTIDVFKQLFTKKYEFDDEC